MSYARQPQVRSGRFPPVSLRGSLNWSVALPMLDESVHRRSEDVWQCHGSGRSESRNGVRKRVRKLGTGVNWPDRDTMFDMAQGHTCSKGGKRVVAVVPWGVVGAGDRLVCGSGHDVREPIPTHRSTANLHQGSVNCKRCRIDRAACRLFRSRESVRLSRHTPTIADARLTDSCWLFHHPVAIKPMAKPTASLTMP